jgi:hypothetical protein
MSDTEEPKDEQTPEEEERVETTDLADEDLDAVSGGDAYSANRGFINP